jgi:hypothetical protein
MTPTNFGRCLLLLTPYGAGISYSTVVYWTGVNAAFS